MCVLDALGLRLSISASNATPRLCLAHCGIVFNCAVVQINDVVPLSKSKHSIARHLASGIATRSTLNLIFSWLQGISIMLSEYVLHAIEYLVALGNAAKY